MTFCIWGVELTLEHFQWNLVNPSGFLAQIRVQDSFSFFLNALVSFLA